MASSSRCQKPKSKELQKIDQDIREIAAAAPRGWFRYKPDSGSSKQQENYSPISSPEKPAKRKAATIKSEPIDLSLDDSDSDCAVSSNERSKKKKKKQKAPTTDDDDDDDTVDMSFCLYVQTPPPPILSTRRNTKPLPPKVTTLGPFEITSASSFSEFISVIAAACDTNKANLSLDSLQWKFDRPANSKAKPVTNDVGFRVMVKALVARRKDYDFSVLMAPPSAVKTELPWARPGESSKTPMNFEFGVDDLAGGGAGVLSIRDQIDGIDKASNADLEALMEAYPVDNDPLLPGKHIFRNATGYFDLTQMKLRVWAVAKAKGTATLTEPPASNHFSKSQAIKPPRATGLVGPAAAPAVPAAPAAPADLLHLLLGNPNLLQMLPMFQQPPAPPPYGYMPPQPYAFPHGMPAPPPAQIPPPVQAAVAPPLELPREISLDEYCDRYKFIDEDRRVLQALGYTPGDDGIKDLDAASWAATNVLPLAKGCILRQHGVFWKDVANGLWD
ncbi:hypothetical protein C8R46DRAFT_1041461 [Mycena filopes]|nr:hypothetical protein C8R46DRAFT_1041461 [Mycena filopes]